MYKIVEKKRLAPGINYFVVEAPFVAKKRKPGQFIVFRLHERGERIPVTIVDSDAEKGTITLIVQEVGKSTYELGLMKEGDYIMDVVGPLGKPTHIEKVGTVLCIGGGVGTAVIYPIARGFYDMGNEIVTIIGARTKELLILEREMREFSKKVYITTDDGSYGIKGFVTDALKLAVKEHKIDLVVTAGPAIMMKFVAKMTKEYGIKTYASLNSIMIDATGMCGVCRVEVGGETKFACVDGPEFDAHLVNFDLLMERLSIYKEQEKMAFEKFLKEKGVKNE